MEPPDHVSAGEEDVPEDPDGSLAAVAAARVARVMAGLALGVEEAGSGTVEPELSSGPTLGLP